MQLMSFSLAVEPVLYKTKTVTRRVGWDNLKDGALICAVRKSMGLRKGETVERLAVLRVTHVTREQLRKLLDHPDYGRDECAKEGFGIGTECETPQAFVNFFLRNSKSLTPESFVTRICFEYVDRPSIAQYEQSIEDYLREFVSPRSAKDHIHSQRKAVGRLWADGASIYQAVYKLWPHALQLPLPGIGDANSFSHGNNSAYATPSLALA
jgi:hypothetical protein